MSAVIDTMIAATTAMSAALDLGLGTCFLGGLRLNDKAANKILNIEGDATVVMGLAVGYEEGKSIHRPKINKVYDDQYHIDKVKEELAAYDILMSSYYKTVFNKDTNFTTISAESLKKLDATTSASNSAQKVKK
jgi:FMN reductase [NAD(P)H]